MSLPFRLASLVAATLVLAACSTTQEISLPAPPRPGEPQGIAGLSAAQLRVAFGQPAFVRKDGTSQMWRYDSARCKAFFFLYDDDGTYAVRHVETIPRGSDRLAADTTCLDALRAQASPPVS